jgi:ribonucleoside-diphosphate reductase alpha chain
VERGNYLDAKGCSDILERFSNKIAIAPTASISIICGGSSPGIEPYPSVIYNHKTLSGSVIVKNKYFEELLEGIGRNTQETWSSIIEKRGSVQHLDFLSQNQRDVFKTAFEIDQRWIIDLAAYRQRYICQSQSLNLFLPSNISKAELHGLHFSAWEKGIKSLYYVRSKSESSAEFIGESNTCSLECESCQ